MCGWVSWRKNSLMLAPDTVLLQLGRSRWNISFRGLQLAGKFRWRDSFFFSSLSFSFPINRWCEIGSLLLFFGLKNSCTWSFQRNLFIKVLFPFPHSCNQILFGHPLVQGVVLGLNSDCHKQYYIFGQTFCFSGPQFFLLQNEGAGSSC